MIVNSIYSKLVQQCKDVASVDIKSMNCAQFASNFPNVPVIYLYSKRDEYVECSDSMEIFDKLSTNFKYFIDCQAKHNEARREEKIKRVFDLFNELKQKKDKKARMSRSRNNKKLAGSSKRLKGSQSRTKLGKKPLILKRSKNMSSGNLLKIKELDNDWSTAKKTKNKFKKLNKDYSKKSLKMVYKTKQQSIYSGIHKKIAKEKKMNKKQKKKSKSPKITPGYYEEALSSNNHLKPKKRNNKTPQTNQSFLSDKHSNKYISIEKPIIIPQRNAQLSSKSVKSKQDSKLQYNSNEQNYRSVQSNQNDFEIELDIDELAEKFNGLQSEIRMFEIPKTQKADFLQKKANTGSNTNRANEINNFQKEIQNSIRIENKTHWKGKPAKNSINGYQYDSTQNYVTRGTIPKGHSQEPMYISRKREQNEQNNIKYKASISKDMYKPKATEIKSRSIDYRKKPNTHVYPRKDDKGSKINNISKLKGVKYSTRTTTTGLTSQSESNQDRLSGFGVKKRVMYGTNLLNPPKMVEGENIKMDKIKNKPSTYSNNEAQVKTKPDHNIIKKDKQRVYITKQSGRNTQPKVTISYQASTELKNPSHYKPVTNTDQINQPNPNHSGRFHENKKQTEHNEIFNKNVNIRKYSHKTNPINKYYLKNTEKNELQLLKEKIINKEYSDSNENKKRTYTYKEYRLQNESNKPIHKPYNYIVISGSGRKIKKSNSSYGLLKQVKKGNYNGTQNTLRPGSIPSTFQNATSKLSKINN